ncbi:hypothetical protein VNO78_12134 [Psophocarpus tetragonolobus]|uniref:Uncharacterized protein n=1 Tax=Psophocarpus tetragonolobus TaxID=3891 RepID=A0AAN9SMV0_PSOTE
MIIIRFVVVSNIVLYSYVKCFRLVLTLILMPCKLPVLHLLSPSLRVKSVYRNVSVIKLRYPVLGNALRKENNHIKSPNDAKASSCNFHSDVKNHLVVDRLT